MKLLDRDEQIPGDNKDNDKPTIQVHHTLLSPPVAKLLVYGILFGVFSVLIVLGLYSRRSRLTNLGDRIYKIMLIRDIKKEITKHGLLVELESCKFLNKLGNGQFGHVIAAIVSTKPDNSGVTIDSQRIGKVVLNNQSVAIKQLKSGKCLEFWDSFKYDVIILDSFKYNGT